MTAGDARWVADLDRVLQGVWALSPEPPARPGCVVRAASPAIALDYSFTLGPARGDRPAAMGAESAFHIASVGKAMTAALLLQLVEDGALDGDALDRPVGDLPALEDIVRVAPALGNPGVTLRRMLNHTSGLRDAFSDDGDLTAAENGGRPAPRSLSSHLRVGGAGPWRAWDASRPDEPTAGVVNWFVGSGAGAALVAAPGARFHYSDTAYMIMAVLIERLSGQTYGAALARRIFQPLGMDASFLAYAAEAPAGWQGEVSDFLFAGRPIFSSGGDASWDWGGGGQVSTAPDLDLFLRGLFGGRLFQRPETVADMTRYIAPPGLPEGCTGLGLGVRRLRSPGGLDLHGHAGAWSVQAFYNPGLDLTITGSFNRPMSDPALRNWVFAVADGLLDLTEDIGGIRHWRR